VNLTNSTKHTGADYKTLTFSKTLSDLKNNLNALSIPLGRGTSRFSSTPVSLGAYTTRPVNKNLVTTSMYKRMVSFTEPSYVYYDSIGKKSSSKNFRLNLHTMYNLYSKKNYPLLFDFNINTNLENAKQQRWFVRNSLLSESIINNSFLVTQAKKIIGLGSTSRDFSSNTL
jgi:hypothetical protein